MVSIFDETMSSIRPEIQAVLRKTGIKSERIRIELSKKEFDLVFSQEVEEELSLNLGEKIELKIFFNMSSDNRKNETVLPKFDLPKNTKKKNDSVTDRGFHPKLESKGFRHGLEAVVSQQKQMMEEIAKRKEENLKRTHDFLDGSRYIGETKDDLPFGKGVCHYANGNKFVGKITQCLNDGKFSKTPRISGSGVLYYNNRNKYVGEIRDDVAYGSGVIHFSNGSTYEGEVSDDQANGQGILYLATGQCFDGQWIDDKFLGEDNFGESPTTNGKPCSVF